MSAFFAIASRRALRGARQAGLAAALVVAPQVCAQSTPAVTPPNDVKITVSEVHSQGQLINVPVNKAVLVDFSVPLKEVRIAKPEIAEVTATSPKQVLVTGKSFGTTQLIAWLDGNGQKVFDVAVDVELDRLQASIRTAVPRADVRAYAVLDSVVLTGTVPDADAAQRVMEIAGIYSTGLINQMKVGGSQQVLLRCTVAEVNRRAIRQLGFNGWLGGDNFHDLFAVNQLDGINPVNIGAVREFGPIGGRLASPIPFVTDRTVGLPLSPRPELSLGFPRMQMQLFIQALRENGLLRVLAEPNLVAINGQEATFLAGGEIPIPIATDERIKIEYKQFGVLLKFTPAVVSESNIRLHVNPEISEPDPTNAVTFGGIAIPGFTARRVDTTVEIGSGQTFAIGGLLSERLRGVTRKIPALGDIPVLGQLFSSVDYQQDNTELVVLVTPELVEPISADQVTAVPGAGLVPPNDFELFTLGQIEGAGSTSQGLPPRMKGAWPVKPAELYQAGGSMKLSGPIGPAGSEEGS